MPGLPQNAPSMGVLRQALRGLAEIGGCPEETHRHGDLRASRTLSSVGTTACRRHLKQGSHIPEPMAPFLSLELPEVPEARMRQWGPPVCAVEILR